VLSRRQAMLSLRPAVLSLQRAVQQRHLAAWPLSRDQTLERTLPASDMPCLFHWASLINPKNTAPC
jgi:hypothetical protein